MMHTRWVIWKLLAAGIDIDRFLSLVPEKDGGDYETIGLPDQSLTSYLKNEGIIIKLRTENKANAAGNKTKHSIWGRGRCFKSFADYWQKNHTKFNTTASYRMDCGQPVAV